MVIPSSFFNSIKKNDIIFYFNNLMNRIEEKFISLKDKRLAIIPYITVGCPDIATSYELVFELERSGADILELGVAFSDPLADGVTIQKANKIAQDNNITLIKVVEFIKQIRQFTSIPIALLTYCNPIFVFGLEEFIVVAKDCGVDGVIVVDLPIDEAMVFKKYADREDISTIFLVAPTTPLERAKRIAELTTGFIYYVSVTGTTGVREEILPTVEMDIKNLKAVTTKPICVGFGISKPEHISYLSSFADGAIIGSAIVKLTMEEEKNKVVATVGKFLREFIAELVQGG